MLSPGLLLLVEACFILFQNFKSLNFCIKKEPDVTSICSLYPPNRNERENNHQYINILYTKIAFCQKHGLSLNLKEVIDHVVTFY